MITGSTNLTNGEEMYWQGVYETCLYFFEELGFEDAMDTSIAMDAKEALGYDD